MLELAEKALKTLTACHWWEHYKHFLKGGLVVATMARGVIMLNYLHLKGHPKKQGLVEHHPKSTKQSLLVWSSAEFR